MIRVLVADDNPIIRGGLVGILDITDEMHVVAQASTGKEALAQARAHRPHVALLDVRMPVMDGIAAAGPLSELCRVLMLTYADDAEIVTGAVRAGASGYLVHGAFTPDELVAAIREVHRGGSVVSPSVAPALFEALRRDESAAPNLHAKGQGLTERECDVMSLIARGLSNQAIGAQLFISDKTVKNHINRLYTKLGVTTRAEAIAHWLGSAPNG